MARHPINLDSNGPPQPPIQTMTELLNSAQSDWKCKRKDQAFITLLGALALMSAGVAQSIRTAEAALKEVEELKKK